MQISKTSILFTTFLISINLHAFNLKNAFEDIVEEIVIEPKGRETNAETVDETDTIESKYFQSDRIVVRDRSYTRILNKNSWAEEGTTSKTDVQYSSQHFKAAQSELLKSGFDSKKHMAIIKNKLGNYFLIGKGHIDQRDLYFNQIFQVDPNALNGTENQIVTTYERIAEITENKFNNAVAGNILDKNIRTAIELSIDIEDAKEMMYSSFGSLLEPTKEKAIFDFRFGDSPEHFEELALSSKNVRLLDSKYTSDNDKYEAILKIGIYAYYTRFKFKESGLQYFIIDRINKREYTSFVKHSKHLHKKEKRSVRSLFGDMKEDEIISKYHEENSFLFIEELMRKKYNSFLNDDDPIKIISAENCSFYYTNETGSIVYGMHRVAGRTRVYPRQLLLGDRARIAMSYKSSLQEKLNDELMKIKSTYVDSTTTQDVF